MSLSNIQKMHRDKIHEFQRSWNVDPSFEEEREVSASRFSSKLIDQDQHGHHSADRTAQPYNV